MDKKMKHGSSNRRQRNRGNGQRRGGNQKTQVFDSNGPDVRIRGTAFQVAEKYVALAKDAQASGDTVLYQSYLQHAEHYQRMINSWEQDSQSFEITDVEYENKKSAKKNSKQDGSEDDLSLPYSILGKDMEEKSKENSELESQ